MSQLFQTNRFRSQRRKKARGALRRVRRSAATPEVLVRVLGIDDWFDYWHEHLDWDGLGNLSLKLRRIYCAGYAQVFRHFALQGHRLGKPYQLWIFLSVDDAGQDAVYMHTPNPNTGSSFPEKFSDVRWGVPELVALFSPWLPEFSLVAGHSGFGLYLFAEGYGVLPEQESAA